MKKLLCLYLFLCVVGPALAQDPGEGAYAFASLDNRGFDSVNLGNLNTRFNVPLVSRQGRGLPFNYSIQYEGLIWQAITSASTTTWVPDPTWGFSGLLNGTAFAGYLTNKTTMLLCPNANPRYTGSYIPWLTNYTYHDPFGSSHLFNYTQKAGCPGGQSSTTGDGSTSDGSGYSLVSSGTQVRSKNGVVITPSASANGSDNTNITDTNGNQITSSGGNSFIDTLGKTALTITGSSPRVFTYPVTLQANSATTASASISYKTYTVRTNFGCSGIVEYGSASASLVDRITLADGSFYAFTYEPTVGATDGAVTARLASITLRTGGTIDYSYSAGCGAGINGDGTVGSLTRTTSDGKRTYVRSPVNVNAQATTVTDEKSNQAVYQFTIASGLFYETHRQVYQGTQGGSPLMERFTCYNGAAASCDGQAVTPPLTQVAVTTSYNGGTQDLSKTSYDTLGNLLVVGEYNGSSVLEQTAYTYNANSEVRTATTTDGSGTVSSIVYGYDETTPTSTSGLPQHTTAAATRGNQTSVTVSTSSSATLKTTVAYYDTGMPVSTTAPTGTTGYQYDPTQTLVTQTSLPTPSSGVALSTSAAYDANSTAALSVTGLNAVQTTTITGYDQLLRPTSATLPNTSVLSITYSSPNSVSGSQTLGGGSTAQTMTLTDGYGRPSRSAVANGQGGGNPWYQSDTCYDATGFVNFVSVSYQGSGFGASIHCSGAGTSYTYDALGRVTATTTSDGTATTTYLGRSVQTKDVNGVQRITQYDYLGQVSGICEISSNSLAGQTPGNCVMDIPGTGYVTGYGHNLSGHTFSIAQGPQTRYFQTDWAGRPATNSEPERGITSYSYAYNATGLQVTRTRPKANQASTSIYTHTMTQYDSLGRPVSVTYDDGLTPNKTYFYDTVPSVLQWNQTPSNPKGQLVATSSGSGSTLTRSLLNYDLMGNVTSLLQCAPSICGGSAQSSRGMSFGYDLGNHLISEGDGASGEINYTRSPAGEVTSIVNASYQGTGNPANLVSNVVNSPFGPTSYSLGNGLQTAQSYDSLGRNSGGWVCSGSSQAYCSGGSQLYGNLVSWDGARAISSCDTSVGQCQFNNYDEFSRLNNITSTTNGGPLGSYTFSYDRWGNRLSQTSSSGGPSPNAAVSPATNQIVGYSYDAAGNLTNDGLSHSFTYDAEGNVLQVNGGSGGSYVYDALNHRVRVQTSSGTNEYNFDPFGQRVSTWLTSINFGIEGRIYWDGKQIAYRAQNGDTFFEHQSVLGTERLRTNYQGAVAASESSGAFGDNFKQNVALSEGDQDNNQYAGQEADPESGSSHAQFRQYSSTLGRWMSPDPYDGSYDITNPQSFNRYSYVLNNPYSLTDPSGQDVSVCDDSGNCYQYSDEQWDELIANGLGDGISIGADGNINCTDSSTGSTTNCGSVQYTNTTGSGVGATISSVGTIVAPSNPTPTPNPVDVKINQCKSEANAAAAKQPSALPNGNGLFVAVVNSAVSAARTGNVKGAVIGFVQGLIVRPVINLTLQNVAYSSTLNACLSGAGLALPSPGPVF